jgi:hypothetical protein
MRLNASIAIALTLVIVSLAANANDSLSVITDNRALIANANANMKSASITIGETYPFAEQDLLEQIQKHIETNKKAIEARLKTKQSQAREQITYINPKT